MEVVINTRVFATEKEDSVRKAVKRLFPDATIEVCKGPETRGGSGIHAKAADLETFTTRIRDQKIRNTARTVLSDSVVGNDVSFYINKQAAFAGKVNFTDGDSLLGDIRVTIRCDDPEALIDGIVSKEVTD
jgi:predicted RNA binding protein with dsRBD fold (UPF0201 family)